VPKWAAKFYKEGFMRAQMLDGPEWNGEKFDYSKEKRDKIEFALHTIKDTGN